MARSQIITRARAGRLAALAALDERLSEIVEDERGSVPVFGWRSDERTGVESKTNTQVISVFRRN